ncbi:SRPBCC domain-containing protein [Marinicella sp. W31]|uniref:SRPBCC family protein n=1 Tax=Marinicella sp. W31 TaxID=3023713 RepID=UPI0037581EBB
MTDSTIMKKIFLAASKQTVWAFLTQKDKLAQWFHPCDSDWEEGQDYQLYMQAEDGSKKVIIWGSVLQMDIPNKLVYTFCIEPFSEPTTITCQLDSVYDGTVLTLTHEGIEAATGDAIMPFLLDLDKGWEEHLDQIRQKFNPSLNC